jgi:hypothetical protein
MKLRMKRVISLACIAMIGSALVPGTGRTAARRANPCLDCHGPFEKITEATANWEAPSREKTSPHRYVPHDSKQASDIPECTNCHAAHTISPPPAPGSIDLKKVSVDWCYTTCHHEKNFTPCKECHKTAAKE